MLGKGVLVKLDPTLRSSAVQGFEEGLRSHIVGQERAIRAIASIYQIFRAGMTDPSHPLATMLFLGPTGSGKTRVVEATAEVLFGDTRAVIKIDCAEFQHSHEIAKLIGSPPGYLGHRETPPLLTQDNLDKYHTEIDPCTLLLFDEIEKASESLWQLLLGVMDKAALTLGDNRKVDFSRTMIFMTSNIGARQMSELIGRPMGFAPAAGGAYMPDELDQKIYRTASEAARRKFSPEFINRIDKMVVFRGLKSDDLCRILDLELSAVQQRIYKSAGHRFGFTLSQKAKEFLMTEGTDSRYGARHIKRSIERFLVYPLASLVSSGQVQTGNMVFVDFDNQTRKLIFSRSDGESTQPKPDWEEPALVQNDSEKSYVAA